MRKEYDLDKMKGSKNPYASRLKNSERKPVHPRTKLSEFFRKSPLVGALKLDPRHDK